MMSLNHGRVVFLALIVLGVFPISAGSVPIALEHSPSCCSYDEATGGYPCIGFNDDDSSYLVASSFAYTFNESQIACEAFGGYLLHLSSNLERMFLNIAGRYAIDRPDVEYVYIGAGVSEREGLYQNVLDNSGLDTTIIDWDSQQNQPGDAIENEDCVVYSKASGRLHDKPCSQRYNFICEIPYHAYPHAIDSTDYVKFPCGRWNTGTPTQWKMSSYIDTYSRAKAQCELRSGYLLKVDSLTKIEWLNTCKRQINLESNGWVYVGADDIRQEGNFVHVHDGTIVNTSIVEWQDGQPDNYQGVEDCVAFSKLDGKFNDKTCSNRYQFACELPKS